MALYIGILSYMSIPMFFTIFSSRVVAGCCWLCQPAVGTRESSIGPPELTPLIWSPSVCHWPWRWFLEKNNKHWDVSTLQYAGKQPYLYKYTRFSCRLKWFNKIVIYMDIYIYKWLNSSKLTKKHRETVVCSRQIQGVPLKFLGQNRRIHYHVTIFDTKNAKPLLQLSPASLASMVFSFPSGICQWGQPEKCNKKPLGTLWRGSRHGVRNTLWLSGLDEQIRLMRVIGALWRKGPTIMIVVKGSDNDNANFMRTHLSNEHSFTTQLLQQH